MLARIASLNRQHPEGLPRLIEMLRSFHDHGAPNVNSNSALGGIVSDRAPGGQPTVPHVAPPGPARDFEDSQGSRKCNFIYILFSLMIFHFERSVFLT